jgi:hypothetical protein
MSDVSATKAARGAAANREASIDAQRCAFDALMRRYPTLLLPGAAYFFIASVDITTRTLKSLPARPALSMSAAELQPDATLITRPPAML